MKNVSVWLVLIFVLFISLFSTNLQNSFAEQSHQECMQNIPQDSSITFAQRQYAVKECATAKLSPYEAITDRHFGTSEKILQFCEYRYPVHLITNDAQFQVLLGHPWTRACLLLYDDPIWEYTGLGRAQVLMDYLHENMLQHLEETKEQRQNSVFEAKLRHGNVLYLQDDIIQRLTLVKELFEQIQEKDQQIARNDAIIREQLAVIQELTAKIKNIVLTSTNLPEDVDVDAVFECVSNANIESLPIFEKVLVMKECAKIDKIVLIEIRDTIITAVTKNILDFCEEGYPIYEQLSKQKYMDALKHPFTRECAWLYEQPVWSNQDPDRSQTLLDFVKPHVKEELGKNFEERKKSIEKAHLSKGRLIGLEDLLKPSMQRMESLEEQIHEKDELIARQDAVIREQMKTINKLSEKIENTT